MAKIGPKLPEKWLRLPPSWPNRWQDCSSAGPRVGKRARLGAAERARDRLLDSVKAYARAAELDPQNKEFIRLRAEVEAQHQSSSLSSSSSSTTRVSVRHIARLLPRTPFWAVVDVVAGTPRPNVALGRVAILLGRLAAVLLAGACACGVRAARPTGGAVMCVLRSAVLARETARYAVEGLVRG